MPDSYARLAESIDRVIRSRDTAPTSEEQLEGAIDRIMLEEARAGELRLAYLRVIVVAPLVVLTLWTLVRDGTRGVLAVQLVPAIASVAWLGIAVALLVALRRGWYERWVPHVTPIVNGAMILAV